MLQAASFECSLSVLSHFVRGSASLKTVSYSVLLGSFINFLSISFEQCIYQVEFIPHVWFLKLHCMIFENQWTSLARITGYSYQTNHLRSNKFEITRHDMPFLPILQLVSLYPFKGFYSPPGWRKKISYSQWA